MENSSVAFFWSDPGSVRPFPTAVCLHGHTFHSEECLSFLPRYLNPIPGIAQAIEHYRRQDGLDFARAYWTPPLTPASALNLEAAQIAGLGLRPLVSLTDHDNIEAPASLQVQADPGAVPVSVEWTVPYGRAILHLGIHNLPPAGARSWLASMAVYTAAPDPATLGILLHELSRIPEVLIVLNHPFWLEEGVEEPDRQNAVEHLLAHHLHCLHALELNGTRKWHENAATIELARAHSLPVISGGDRHACEPAACLNLTSAANFSEFAAEIKAGYSRVLFMPQYREPMALRILEAAWQIVRPYPEFAGRERWTDRVFYRGADGHAQSLSAVWRRGIPWIVRPPAAMLQFFGVPGVRPALRMLLSRRAEVHP